MSAISPRTLEHPQPLPPPGLDDYDKAIFEKKYDQADKILERIYKQNIPGAIQAEIIRVRAEITVTKIEWDIIRRTSKIVLEDNALEKALRKHDFSVCLNLIGQGADPQVQTATGQSLLHVAIEEYYQKPIVDQVLENGEVLPFARPLHVLHILLEMRVDPNQKDSNGITPLAVAAKKGDMYAVYLLLAYGAVPDKEIFIALRESASKRDPLYISSGDSLLFAATCTSWLARGILKVTGSNDYLDAAEEAIHIAGTVAYLASTDYTENFWPKVACITALELMPVTCLYTQIAKTACVAVSSFSGLTGVYNNYINRPWDALKKMTVVTVNSLTSLSDVSTVIASEYGHSQTFKQASDMGLNVQDIDTQPTWTCATYKKLFREASRFTHPDQSLGSTEAHVPLVVAYDFMKKTC